jgi:hypothetical protein
MKPTRVGLGIGARALLGVSALLGATVLTAPTAMATVSDPPVPVSAVPGSSWSPWKACPAPSKENCASVRTITHVGSIAILGGDFSQLRGPNGQTRQVTNLAAVDDAGNPVTTFASHVFNGTVFTLATDGTSLYVGGGFSKVDGKGALHVVKLDAATGKTLTFKGAINGTVYGSVLRDGMLYIGGKFSTVQGLTRGNLAALNPASGAVNTTWAPNATLIPHDAKPNDPSHNNIPIRALAASNDGTRIYIAGDMDLLDGVARPAIAAVNPMTGLPVTTFKPDPSIDDSYQGMGIAVVEASSGLTPGVIFAAGGLFNHAWRLNTNGTINWQINASGDVQAAAVMGSTVFLGGHFDCVSSKSCFDGSPVGDVPAEHIAAFNYNGASIQVPNQNWTPALPTTHAPYYYGVWALQVYGTSLYVGGVFKDVITAGVTYPDSKYVRFRPASTR